MASNTFAFDTPKNGAVALASRLRENFNALGVNNYTVSAGLPPHPRNGMLRFYEQADSSVLFQVYLNSAWQTILTLNSASAAGEAVYKSETFASLAVWDYEHNLGIEPMVQVLDSSGEVVHPEKIQHVSVDRVIVTHSAAITGKIIVVGKSI